MIKTEKKIIVFIGPSLRKEEALSILEAEYRPPVKRGDILKLLQESPDAIGIIDGVFHQEPAVSPREIIEALKAGILVVGGASMGALRASELDNLGMIGVGHVYSQYKNGKIESDDDVAVVFNPGTNEQLSDALVSIRYNFNRAYQKGILSQEDLNILLNTAKSIFYPYRTYKKIFNDSGIDKHTRQKMELFLEQESCNIKYEDAIKVLKYLKNIK